MLTFKEYITEETGAGSLSIFDIDDTLFHTTAQIAVVKDGKTIKKLTNSEFNTYKLGDGESFDFSEFKDAAKFYHESNPIKRMIAKAMSILKNAQKNPKSQVIILTARSNFNDKDKFLATFRKHGFDIDKVRVERAGELVKNEVPAVAKAIVVTKYLNSGQFQKVRLFDDSMSNLKEFLKLQHKFTDVKFEAYFAKPDGSIKTVK
jgi:hypothetical protein